MLVSGGFRFVSGKKVAVGRGVLSGGGGKVKVLLLFYLLCLVTVTKYVLSTVTLRRRFSTPPIVTKLIIDVV